MMRCVPIVLFVVASASCSVVQINETTFASLPRLYDLDDWAQCQRAGDVYCMVDAALVAREGVTALTLLQNYSKQSFKHYNRSVIHRGVCITSCVEDQGVDRHEAAQRCLEDSVAKYDLQVEVTSVNWCSTVGEAPVDGSSSARALAVLCVVLVALSFLATVLHVIGDRCAKTDGNKYLLAFSMKRNWSILTYDRARPRSDDRMKNLTAIEGIRAPYRVLPIVQWVVVTGVVYIMPIASFYNYIAVHRQGINPHILKSNRSQMVLGMECVIFSHVLFVYVYSYTDNPQFIEQMYDQFGWQAVLNSPLWLQAFFSISGFLTTYVILISAGTNDITFVKCIMSVLNRFVRFTPVAGFALWFTIAWYPLLGSGPQWAWMVTRESHECAERWWYHITYLHNYLPLGKFCMGHTWYLAADFQLSILGVFLMLALVKWRKAALPVLGGLVAASSLASGLVTYFYDLTPIITAQSPETLRTFFADNKIVTLIYLPSWMNLPGYAGGMATAFVLHNTQQRGIKLNQNKWFSLLFHAVLTLASCVVFSGVVFLADGPPPRWAAALYSTLDRTLVAICFNIFLLGCFTQCKSVFRDMLEWRGFHTLGRLSFSVYVIHFVILRLAFAGNTQLGHISIFAMMSLLITISVFSYVIAIPCCLLIELPAIELWKAITSRERNSDRPSNVTASPVRPPLPSVKPMDLLAHIRRRTEV